MKKTIRLAATLLAISMLLSACSGGTGSQTSSSPSQSPENTGSSEVSETASNAETPPESSREETGGEKSGSMKIDYSTAFSVDYITEDILLVTDGENQKFLLVPRGQAAPSGYDDTLVLYTPVERALFSSSTQYGMIAPFDVWDAVGGIMASGDEFPFAGLSERVADGRILHIGNANTPDYELIRMLDPEITFVYTGFAAQTAIIEKLEELELPYAVDNEYLEEHHRGRMEWMKFLAAFFGIAEEVVEYVEEMFDRLDEMEALVAGADKPKVAWGRVDSGMTRVAGNNSYVIKMLESVGCINVFAHIEGTGSGQLTPEEFYDGVKEADIWIHGTTPLTIRTYGDILEEQPVLEGIPSMVNKNVWMLGPEYYNLTGEIDMQVIELASIIHPDLFPQITEYRQFAPLGDD